MDGQKERFELGEAPEGHYRMVVPAPPARPPAQHDHRSERADVWPAEPEGVDWLLILLTIAALVAVMGLIPLWRSVYRRYTVPPDGSTPSSYLLPVQDRRSDIFCAQRQGHQKVKATENTTSLESAMISFCLVAGLRGPKPSRASGGCAQRTQGWIAGSPWRHLHSVAQSIRAGEVPGFGV